MTAENDYRQLVEALAASEARERTLREALDCRDLFSNPKLMRHIADEIDCGFHCENCWREWDTNAAGCYASEAGKYCPNDLAETLRALAAILPDAPAPETGDGR